MLCPGCETQNPDDAVSCSACGKRLPTRKRRRPPSEETNVSAGPEAERCNRAGLRAYRLCIVGLLPGAGLILGPIAMLLGIVATVRGNSVPGFTAKWLAAVSVLLGGLITAFQWTGVTLMVLGWHVRR
jgi:hypothetical protein